MSNIRIHENGFEITLNDIVINVFEYKDEPWKGYVNIVIRTVGDLVLRHAFDVDVQGWDNAINTLETIERLVSTAIELAKEHKEKFL
jgi:hypothetical protein